MVNDLNKLSKIELRRLKAKIEKRLEANLEKAVSVNSRDEDIKNLADNVKAIAKSRGVTNDLIVEAICRRFKLKLKSES